MARLSYREALSLNKCGVCRKRKKRKKLTTCGICGERNRVLAAESRDRAG